MKNKRKPKPSIRCAIYTRKSTDEGLEMDFNSLDAQTEACANYIKSQKSEGWIQVAEKYEDAAVSGGTLERPALKRLISDIESDLVDVVVVYKMDRLSRSLLDFAQLAEIFEQNNASFTSVTQSFSTTTSMGRLTLNMLLSFAQFEREVISERIRDKYHASRKRGIFMGGRPILGYDIGDRKLIINHEEAKTVRHIFKRFTKIGSATKLVQELKKQGVVGKCWTSSAGREHVGKPFTKNTLYTVLKNRTYIGDVAFKGEVYPGEHDAIIDKKLWDQVHSIFDKNRHQRANRTRSQSAAPLQGLIRCGSCKKAMYPTYSKKRNKSYAYYLCSNVSKNGHNTCPLRSVPAGDIEKLVFDQLREIFRTPEMIAKVWLSANELDQHPVSEREIRDALTGLEPVWDTLFPAEQSRIIGLLVRQIEVYPDGVEIRLIGDGIDELTMELLLPADEIGAEPCTLH
ncbi:MAG: recombinase family protein [Magnetococcales bacterium]|nr:recombinase family protein [Magnetococcales bacterium]